MRTRTIDLTEAQVAEAREIGRRRWAVQRGRNVTDELMDTTMGPLSPDETGALGEYAFHVLYATEKPPVYDMGDGGKVDFQLAVGAVQVKTASRQGLNFIMPQQKALTADFGVLMELCKDAPRRVREVGWLSRDEWERMKRLTNFGKGPTWIVQRRFLHGEFWKLLHTAMQPSLL